MTATKKRSNSTNGKGNDHTDPPGEIDSAHGFVIPRPEMMAATLHLTGISPLLVHRFSEKAKTMMEDKQTGKAASQKESRNPDQERRDNSYVVPGREDWRDGEAGKYFLPGSMFKHAYLYGVAQLGDKTRFPKTKATGWVFPVQDPIIQFASITARSDVARIGGQTANHVYRFQFNDWSVDLDISYNELAISLEQVMSLFDLGGNGGIGEWRPSSPQNKSGMFGRFQVTGVDAGGKS